jgi:hypothetical protein
MRGKEIIALVNVHKPAGYHQFGIDGVRVGEISPSPQYGVNELVA